MVSVLQPIHVWWTSFLFRFWLADEKKQVNCDRSEEIDILIQKDGKNFGRCSFKRKGKIINLQSLCSSIIIEKAEVTIGILAFFLRLAFVVEGKPEAEMENYFYYELTVYPTSLFKDGAMRTPKNKAKLKNYLLEGNITSEGKHCIRRRRRITLVLQLE